MLILQLKNIILDFKKVMQLKKRLNISMYIKTRFLKDCLKNSNISLKDNVIYKTGYPTVLEAVK